MNTVFIEGNVSGIKINDKSNFIAFSLAENITFKNKSNQKVTETHWYNVVAYNGTAQFIERNLIQGDKVLIQGRLTTNSYEKDGKKVTTVQIIASDVRVTYRKQQ